MAVDPSPYISACMALEAYGYESDDHAFTRSKGGVPRDQYVPVAGEGFLRFTRVDGQWKGVPYTIGPGFEGISGLDSNKPEHAPMFDWAYPAEEILRIYSTGLEARAAALAEHAARRLS